MVKEKCNIRLSVNLDPKTDEKLQDYMNKTGINLKAVAARVLLRKSLEEEVGRWD